MAAQDLVLCRSFSRTSLFAQSLSVYAPFSCPSPCSLFERTGCSESCPGLEFSDGVAIVRGGNPRAPESARQLVLGLGRPGRAVRAGENIAVPPCRAAECPPGLISAEWGGERPLMWSPLVYCCWPGVRRSRMMHQATCFKCLPGLCHCHDCPSSWIPRLMRHGQLFSSGARFGGKHPDTALRTWVGRARGSRDEPAALNLLPPCSGVLAKILALGGLQKPLRCPTRVALLSSQGQSQWLKSFKIVTPVPAWIGTPHPIVWTRHYFAKPRPYMWGAVTFSPDPWNTSMAFNIIPFLMSPKTRLAVGFELRPDLTACSQAEALCTQPAQSVSG